MEKIAILRWESGHVPQGLMQLEQLPGNSTNLASYPFPVKLVEVKGANTDTVILHPSQKLLEDMIQLAKELVRISLQQGDPAFLTGLFKIFPGHRDPLLIFLNGSDMACPGHGLAHQQGRIPNRCTDLQNL